MLSRRVRSEDGQAMAEFAMIVPVLLLVVIGIIYLGRILTYMSDTTHLAEIAVRYAAVNEDPACSSVTPNNCSTTLAQYVQTQAIGGEFSNGGGGESGAVTSTGGVQVCISAPSGDTGAQGTPIQATVTGTFQLLPFLNFTSIPISEKASEMMEQNADSSVYTGDTTGPSC
jgi:Flp pilus assembly protein TadG